jgi:hypothetical protein
VIVDGTRHFVRRSDRPSVANTAYLILFDGTKPMNGQSPRLEALVRRRGRDLTDDYGAQKVTQ